MELTERLLDRAFGRPKGLLGRIGGRIMSRTGGEVAEEIVDRLTIQPTDCVLEVGFGPGVGIMYARRAARSGTVIGVDVSEEMATHARARNASAVVVGQVAILQGSAEHLPLRNGSVDAAFASNSIHVWSDPGQGLREMHRVLRAGGSIAVSITPHADFPFQQLPILLENAGFENVRVEQGNGATFAFGTASEQYISRHSHYVE